jgi:hypothetical protein
MSDYLDKTRLLVAKREDEDAPYIIGAMPQTTWEVFDPEEYDEWKRKTAERFFDADWTAYDYIEVVMVFPNKSLADLFAACEIRPVAMEVQPPASGQKREPGNRS